METKYVTHQDGETFVIYDASLAETKPPLKEPSFRFSQLKKRVGILCLALSLTGLFVFISPILTGEIKYRLNQLSPNEQVLEEETKVSGFGQLLWLDKKGVVSPNNWEFSLIIPSIQLNAKVENSIDPGDSEVYQDALKTGVAHAKGTSYPDQPGTVYIFGHSTDYPWNITRYHAYFYPLRYLNENEEVILIYQGKNFLYEVKEKKIVEAGEVDYLISQNDEKKLVLQTCWPPGTTWKRLIVIARPVEET